MKRFFRRFVRHWIPPLMVVGLAAVARAGTIDTSDITNQAGLLLNVFEVIGAIAAIVAVIFSALAIRGRNVGEGVVGVLCAILAIFVIGHAEGWVTSITGVAVP